MSKTRNDKARKAQRKAVADANAAKRRCSCGSPEAYSLTEGEVLVHRFDGKPCYIGDAR